jgi:uncharacterized protein YjaG (DUF416 family)
MIGVNDDVLEPTLCLLSKAKQLTFALMLCERLMPFFSWFASQTSFGTTSTYRKSLDDAWRHLADTASTSDWLGAARACTNGAPDMDDFDHPLKSAALSAALSVELTMEFLTDGDVAHVLEAAQLTNDVAAMYANSQSARPPLGLSDDELIEHPYMRRELERQLEDLEFVKSLPTDFAREMIPTIKERVWLGPAR